MNRIESGRTTRRSALRIGSAGLIAAAVGLTRRASAQAQGAATPAASDLPEIVAAYAAAIGSHDAAAVVALYASDAVVTQAVRDGGTFRGPDEIGTWVGDNLAAIPDLIMTTMSAVAQADRIAWEWVYNGTYTGNYPALPAGQGQAIELRGASFLVLRDGLIAGETVYFDNADFLAQTAGAATGTPAAGG